MRLKLTSLIVCTLFTVILSGIPATGVMAGDERDQKQAELDAACEQAREQKLAPLREKFVQECVQNKEQDSREACVTFYADYGGQSGNRAPLFYDLPACVTAFDYQNSAGV
jgi:hypothetical protein